MKLKLTVDGALYEVEVEVAEVDAAPGYLRPVSSPPASTAAAPSPGLAAAAKPSATAAPVDERKVCRSPIAGVVVRVAVQPGQQIAANDVLLVLEAMKMETVITSPSGGKIAKVNAAPGEPVQVGQLLVELE